MPDRRSSGLGGVESGRVDRGGGRVVGRYPLRSISGVVGIIALFFVPFATVVGAMLAIATSWLVGAAAAAVVIAVAAWLVAAEAYWLHICRDGSIELVHLRRSTRVPAGDLRALVRRFDLDGDGVTQTLVVVHVHGAYGLPKFSRVEEFIADLEAGHPNLLVTGAWWVDVEVPNDLD